MNGIQVFCDESGGSDRANDTFLVAAVACVPAEAEQLLRRFRSAARIKGEVKGTRLTLEQRTLFFDLLTKRTQAVSVVVTCVRSSQVGGWAMGELREIDLYSHLLTEACTALPRLGASRHLTVTPDGGRYKKVELGQVGNRLKQMVAAHLAGTKVSVTFGRSDLLPGL